MSQLSWKKQIAALVLVYVLYLFSWNAAFADGTPFTQPLTMTGYVPALSSPAMGSEITRGELSQELSQHIVYDHAGPNTIGHILIDDRTNGINQSTWLYVKKALDYYKQTKPIFVILELNTPGGEVYAAQLISDALKELDTQYSIPVVTYINNWAISAGAMLAYSTRFIVTATDGSMGAAEPIIQNAEGKMETASEKINSALRTDFANKARYFGRDPLIAEGMVDKNMILVQRDGKVLKLVNASQIRNEGTNPDLLIAGEGKLLTLDAPQMLKFGVADLILPPTKVPQITAGELEDGRWPAFKMALFHQPFFDKIPDATIDAYRMDWKMRFFAFLASPMVSSLLLMGLMLGFYLEVTTPGFGVAGSIALACLFLIVLSSFSLEIANWLEVILLLVGIGIILIEVFVLPTFGLLGFVGLALFIVGLFGMMLPGVGSIGFEFDTQTFNAAGEAFFERLAWLCGAIVAAFVIICILAWYITPSMRVFSRLVLYGNEQVGFQASTFDNSLIGRRGVVVTDLKPGGHIEIDGKRIQAISEAGYVVRGSEVEVIGGQEESLIVKHIKKAD